MDEVDMDILARFQALEDVVAYLLGRYLAKLSSADSEATKDSFMDAIPELGVGLMAVETLQDIQSRIAASKARILMIASAQEGRTWTPKGL